MTFASAIRLLLSETSAYFLVEGNVQGLALVWDPFLMSMFFQASLVRRPAAQNLGALSGMSVRIEALANDLLTQAKSASTNLKEPYLVALQGVLRSSGSRLSQNTLSTAGEALQDLLQNSGEILGPL